MATDSLRFTASWQVHSGSPAALLPEVCSSCLSLEQIAAETAEKLVAQALGCGTVDIISDWGLASRRIAPFTSDSTLHERYEPEQVIHVLKAALLPSETVNYRQDLKVEAACRAAGEDLVQRTPEYMTPRDLPEVHL